MRERLESLLSGTGAFLRCDRGGALYVTNLPARCDRWRELAQAMRDAGFRVEERGALLAVVPDGAWRTRFEQWAAVRCGGSEPPPYDCARRVEIFRNAAGEAPYKEVFLQMQGPTPTSAHTLLFAAF